MHAKTSQSAPRDIHIALQSLEAKEDLAGRIQEEYDGELMTMAMMRVSQRVEAHTWEVFRLLALKASWRRKSPAD